MSDTSTRSGMLWEVERILTELDEKPQVLIMENVPQVHSQDNMKDFHKWQVKLEELGYKNYWQDLIATDYGIPQTRNRTFMVSILGDYSYTFPKPIPLKLKLKDMLEEDVDEKFYLSDKQIEDIKSWNAYEKPLENMEKTDKSQCSPTLTTRSGAYAAGMILIKDKCIGTYQYAKSDNFMQGKDRLQLGKETSDTLQTTPKEGIVNSDLRIRKLTPKECFRLMGVRDEDYENCAKSQTDSSLYHLAGDSIVVNVLMAIFKEMV